MTKEYKNRRIHCECGNLKAEWMRECTFCWERKEEQRRESQEDSQETSK